MHKNMFGRQFKRDANERKALFKGLMTSLVLEERIKTTEEKAKAIKGSVEKLVTKAKKKGNQATPFLLPYLHEDAAKRMIGEIAPRFADRPGGYTRIIKLGRRFGDNAMEVVMEWVEKSSKLKIKNEKLKKSKNIEDTLESEVASDKTVSSHKQSKATTKKSDKKTKNIKSELVDKKIAKKGEKKK